MTPEQISAVRTRDFWRLSESLLAMALALPLAAGAAELLVRITGLSEPLGRVSGSLFAGPAGFPMDNAGARPLWQAAETTVRPEGLSKLLGWSLATLPRWGQVMLITLMKGMTAHQDGTAVRLPSWKNHAEKSR